MNSSNDRRFAPALAAMALACSCAIQAANAAPAEAGRTAIVSYADLDLSHPAGARQLYRRLESAARAVCGPYDVRELQRSMQVRACIERALSDAAAQIDRPLVAALLAKGGKRG